jgi:hypothetical protein
VVRELKGQKLKLEPDAILTEMTVPAIARREVAVARTKVKVKNP